MKKALQITGVVLGGILLIFGIIRLIYGGPEDAWVCENGVWVMHGSPREPQPESSCGGSAVTSPTSSSSDAIANSASEFCIREGGSLIIKPTTDGTQKSACVFDDGRECDAKNYLETHQCGDVPIE